MQNHINEDLFKWMINDSNHSHVYNSEILEISQSVDFSTNNMQYIIFYDRLKIRYMIIKYPS